MSRDQAVHLGFSLLAIAFFATPFAARVLGVSAESFENRRFADPPRISQGWDAFPQATQYLIDRMPLRKQAVEANTHVWTAVFGTDPLYSRDATLARDQALPFAGATAERGDLRVRGGGGPATASTGREGWLYSESELNRACNTNRHNGIALDSWSEMLEAVRAEGREAMLVVAPDKASVYPEHLPDEYLNDHCALPGKERFWRQLAEDGPSLGIYELRSELVRLKANAGDGLFQRKDTHWSTLGALTLVDAVLDRFGDGIRLEPREIVPRGEVTYTGDLTRVGGNAETDTRNEYGIERAPEAPRVPGRTLMICDSFGYRWIRLLKPYFEHIRYVAWYDVDADYAAAIRRSDRVIVEANETTYKASVGGSIASELRDRGS